VRRVGETLAWHAPLPSGARWQVVSVATPELPAMPEPPARFEVSDAKLAKAMRFRIVTTSCARCAGRTIARPSRTIGN
jgi:hypothetical protein